jgi:hypothetical protein
MFRIDLTFDAIGQGVPGVIVITSGTPISALVLMFDYNQL